MNRIKILDLLNQFDISMNNKSVLDVGCYFPEKLFDKKCKREQSRVSGF